MLRGGALTIVAATVITAATLGGTAMRGRSAGRQAPSSATPTAPLVVATADSLAADSAARATQTKPESIVVPNVAPSTLGAPTPILPMGESPLSDGITANRGDSAVVVSFDVQLNRTRRAQKFEQIVRTTLPAIYGPAADSALAHIPDGEIAQQGDLLSELTVRGIRIRLTPPWEIRVYPETRTGPSGPLVVRYRALVVSGG